MPTESTPSSSDPTLATYNSPIGSLTLAARGGALVGLWVAGQRFFGSPYGIDEASARELEQASGGHVVSNVVDEVETVLLAILGRVGDAVLDRVQDGLDRDLFAIFEELARDTRAERATKNAHR